MNETKKESNIVVDEDIAFHCNFINVTIMSMYLSTHVLVSSHASSV